VSSCSKISCLGCNDAFLKNMERTLCLRQLCCGETNSQVIIQPLCDVFGLGEVQLPCQGNLV